MSTPAWLQHLLNVVDHVSDAAKKSAAEAEFEQEVKREARRTKKESKRTSAGELGKAFGDAASCCTAKRDGTNE